MSYFDDIRDGIRTTVNGLKLTLAHIRQATKRRTPVGIASDTYFDLQNGLVTLQYPHEQLPIPDNGRYKLRNEIDDCIVCDKCAKVCPVDCITIDAIKATEEVGRASDGSPIRLYAATFDIDMAKCCYCGLCTVVCPTECLTMDKEFDYSEFDLGKLTYHFSDLTPQQADEKRSLYEQFVREKEAAKQAAKAPVTPADTATAKPRPAFRPTAKPAPPRPEETAGQPEPDATPEEMQQIAQGGLEAQKRPVFRPTQKVAPAPLSEDEKPKTERIEPESSAPTSVEKAADQASADIGAASSDAPKRPSSFRPTMKPPKTAEADLTNSADTTDKPAFRPTMKPPKSVAVPPAESADAPITKPSSAESPVTDGPSTVTPDTPRPAFRPTMKPAATPKPDKESTQGEATQPATPKPAFRPTMKPAKPAETSPEAIPDAPTDTPVFIPDTPSAEKPRPAFRPTMEPAAKASPAKAEELRPETTEPTPEPPAEPKPAPKAFRPTMKPKPADSLPPTDVTSAEEMGETPAEPAEPPKPKPAFRPTMKPKPKDDTN